MNRTDEKLRNISVILEDKRIGMHRIRSSEEAALSKFDLGLRTALYGKKADMKEQLPQRLKRDGLYIAYMITDPFACNYFLFPEPDEDSCRLIGPYLSELMSASSIGKISEKMRLSANGYDTLVQYYPALPKVNDTTLFESILKIICNELYGADGYQIRTWTSEFQSPGQTSGKQTRKLFAEIERRYERERLMMAGIAEGNEEKVSSVLSSLSMYGFESRSTSLFRDMKNYSIVLNTLFRVAAAGSGVHPQTIDRISRDISLRIENAASQNDLRNIRDLMVRQYCQAVRTDQPPVKNLQIRRAKAWIAENFNQPLTLSKTAMALNLSETYLSALFHEETGQTFSEYVRHYRCTAAASLLESTRMSVSEIARYCGIDDSSYFTRIFRRETGMSPLAWRKAHR